MTTRPDMHVGDWGTDFIMTINNRATNKPLDISAADTMLLIFAAPEGQTEFDGFVATPGFNSDGKDGKLKYTFTEFDVLCPGQWRVQAMVQTVDGKWHSDIETFEVGENLEYEEAS